jgi:cephalosporin hydroxylase
VLVLLDTNHSYAHVLHELEAYHRFVTLGSYIVATDGIMQLVHDVPMADRQSEAAARDFVQMHPEFIIEKPSWAFNESPLDKPITAWPSAWLKRIVPRFDECPK